MKHSRRRIAAWVLATAAFLFILIAGYFISQTHRTGVSARTALYREQYQWALNCLISEHVFPDGTPVDVTFIKDGDFSHNYFSVCDIDGDGTEELIISYSYASMVGMVYYILQYMPESEDFHVELLAFPGEEIYTNGYITIQASHNQGIGNSFWPYAVFQYDRTQDVYTRIAFVEAWEKATFPTDRLGNVYPDQVDTSGTGYVYRITKAGQDTGDAPWVDYTDYGLFLESTYGNAPIFNMDYLPITEEHIAGLLPTQP